MEDYFVVRALEIHDRVWDQEHIKKALDFMVNNNLNTMVLHANDIIDEVVWPAHYYGAAKGGTFYKNYKGIFRELYKYSARRRYMPIHRRDFLKWVINSANKMGIQVYLENKELWFPDIVEEIHPELRKKGFLCCSESFWWDFLRIKYEELFNDLSKLAGVITSPGSRESRLSVSGNRCTCPDCQRMDAAEWYFNLIMSIYEPVREAGKQLIIRDFVFDSRAHASLATAITRLPSDIIISLKNTPHDFYPTFPDNPQIGRIKNHKTWVEYDVMGQYFGWGLGPSIMVQDIKKRFEYSLKNGAIGVLIRTDWEGLPGHSCFDTLNIINLYAASTYASNINAEISEIYKRWLEEQKLLAKNLTKEEKQKCITWLMNIFEKTWDIIRKTLYVNNCVFNDSSAFPVSIDHAFWLGEEKNSLQDWDKAKAGALQITAENVLRIIKEKDEAWKQFNMLHQEVLKQNMGLTSSTYKKLKYDFEVFGLYIKGFRLVGRVVALTRYLSSTTTISSGFEQAARELIEKDILELKLYIDELTCWHKKTPASYQVYALLNPERLNLLLDEVSRYSIKAFK